MFMCICRIMESESENQKANVVEPEIEPPAEQNTDDDVVEVEMSNASAMSKRRLSADVWKEFNMLPPGPDKKQRRSCKRCGATYACPSTFGTCNLHKHLERCKRRDTRDIGQLLISRDHGSISLGTKKFDQEKFRELVVVAIIMHCQPYQFVEYEGFRAVFRY